MESPPPLRVLELYSGIGGMHWALKEAGVNFEVDLALDVNPNANQTYAHNFPDVKISGKGIEKLPGAVLGRADVLLMSPPCQPFTRQGKQQDVRDPRTSSLLHVLELIKTSPQKPRYILCENVKGFDGSEAHAQLLATLADADYTTQEFLLTPLQFGIPNSRLRYYLIAKRRPLEFAFTTSTQMWTELPGLARPWLPHLRQPEEGEEEQGVKVNKVRQLGSEQPGGSGEDSLSQDSYHESYKYLKYCRKLRDFLDQDGEAINNYLVPRKELHLFWAMDIVKPSSKRCICFTKGYGHHLTGAGSIVQMASEVPNPPEAWQEQQRRGDTRDTRNDDVIDVIEQWRLRYFTPREIASLMCFPLEFSFAPSSLRIQQYRLLGNSLNVHVVAVLLRLLFASPASPSSS